MVMDFLSDSVLGPSRLQKPQILPYRAEAKGGRSDAAFVPVTNNGLRVVGS